MLKAYRKEVSLTYLYAIFGGLLNLILPLGVQTALNLVQSGVLSSSWVLLVVIVTVGTVFNGALVIMQASLNETLQKRIFTDISFDFAARIPQLDLEQTNQEHLPEVVNRFFETVTLSKGIPKILNDLTAALLQIIFGLILLSFYHPYFIVFGVLLTVLLFVIFRFTSPIGLKTSISESKYKYEVVHWLEELGRTVLTFKHSSQSNYNFKRLDGLVSKFLDAKDSHFKILKLQYWSLVFFKTLITLLLLILGGYLVIRNQINIGQFVAAEIIIILVINASEKMILLMDTVYDVLTSIDKIGHVMDLEIEKTGSYETHTENGMSISLTNLSFTFKDAAIPTLSNINLDIEPNQSVCIAGYNTSGRTTLMQLLASFLKPTEGLISFNNVPIMNYNLAALRGKIGYLSSREHIFKGTIKENISLGFDDISVEEVAELLKKVGLSVFLSQLPNGIDTMLLPEGKNLSRSTTSKILIARALAHKPQILIIEDLLNSLQTEERQSIIQILISKERHWTLVCASDDPNFAAQCDLICILQKGTIVEKGSFEKVKKSAHFKNVFRPLIKSTL